MSALTGRAVVEPLERQAPGLRLESRLIGLERHEAHELVAQKPRVVVFPRLRREAEGARPFPNIFETNRA